MTSCGSLFGQADQPDHDDDHDFVVDDDDDADCDDHRHPTRLETDFILLAIAPFHWGHTFPGVRHHYLDHGTW